MGQHPWGGLAEGRAADVCNLSVASALCKCRDRRLCMRFVMSEEKKEPSAPYGEPDKNETRDKKNPGTGETSAPYGEEGETETTKPARKE